MNGTSTQTIRRSESRFETRDGLSLFRCSWSPPDPRGRIVLVHGFAEHSGRYEAFAAWFGARGWAVDAFDHRGHGRSPGKRNFVRNFDDFLDDVGALLERVVEESGAEPRAIVGHSMGGLISAAFARERKPDLAALALSGPALLSPAAFPGGQRLMLRALSVVAPKLTVRSAVVPEALSRDPEVGRRYVEDPLVDPRMTAGLATQMMAGAARTIGGGADIELPLLLQHGAADPLCPASCSENFAQSRSADGPETELRIYPELRHEIYNEPEREQVMGDLLAWLERVCGLAASDARKDVS